MAVVMFLVFMCGASGKMTMVVLLLMVMVVVRCWRCFVVVFAGGGGTSRKSNYIVYRCTLSDANKMVLIMVRWEDNRSK